MEPPYQFGDPTTWKIHVLPGGTLPERQTRGAIGYDVTVRAICSKVKNDMDPDNPLLRRSLFTFDEKVVDDTIKQYIRPTEPADEVSPWEFILPPTHRVLVGIGFTISMPENVFYWVTPRSGLANLGITIANAPGTVDPDYRGEAGATIVNNSGEPFAIRRGMRIAQIVFQQALLPNFIQVASQNELGETERGGGGFGSTGF